MLVKAEDPAHIFGSISDNGVIVVAAYMSVQKVVCNEEYYYIPGWRAIDNIFYEYRISEDNLMEVLMTK